ncbi:MAG: restriction endonuclease subunit S [Moraxellaceae bacterium]|nr:restriction endonuclease subunit S [Moraxellaceae bacterium]
MSLEKIITLNDVVNSANTGLDAIKRAPIVDANTGIRCLRIQDISQSKNFTEWGFTEVSDNNFLRFQLKKNEILIARTGGSIGCNKLIKFDLQAVFNNGLIRLRINELKYNPVFIYYVLQSDFYKQHIDSIAFGTAAQPNMKIDDLLAFKFIYLERSYQDEIASILSSLDNRISLLRETNTTLEAIAQTLFKSWFVDFDPVKAKAQGKQPEGMDEATAALFPSEFEESALGLIPKGWRVGTLGDVARLHKGSINPLHHQNTVFEHYSLPSFDNGQSPVMEAGIEIKSNKTSVPKNAVLLSKLNPHIPRVWLPSKIGDNAVCSTEFLVFVPADGASKEFIYCIFIADSFQSSLLQLVTGTSNSHQRVKPDTVSALPMVIPSLETQKAFETILTPLFARVGHNRHKAQTLTTLRDTLLPRLISGQLRINQAQDLINEVGA